MREAFLGVRDKRNHLDFIDSLRGVAILGVLIVHYSQAFPFSLKILNSLASFGRFGVQLFFVSSAITLSYVWVLRSQDGEGRVEFYIRRFFRIVPVYVLAVPLYLIINGYGAGYFSPAGVSALDVLLNMVVLHGFWPSAINSVVPGGWSIAVEFSFYILFPFVLLGMTGRFWAVVVFVSILFLSFFSYAAACWIYGSFFKNEFLSIFSKIWLLSQLPVFVVGVLIYKYLFLGREWRLVWWLCFSVLLCAGFFNVFWFVIAFVALVVIIFQKYSPKIFGLGYLGSHSYSIYIFHALAVKVVHFLAVDFLLLNGLYLVIFGWFFSFFLVVVFAPLGYRFLERPFVRFGGHICLLFKAKKKKAELVSV